MSCFVVVHGAFRGPWYWEPLAVELERDGHQLRAVDLVGDSLGEWIECTVSVVDACAPAPVVLVGHSMGGVVVQAALGRLDAQIDRMVLLDAPLIDVGQRAVDVSGPAPVDDAVLPPREFDVPPRPVGPEQGFDDPALAAWVNDRLRPVPMGPQLDPAPTGTGRRPDTAIFFCAHTPEGFPSTVARRRCELDGIAHVVIDTHHDAPVLDPRAVADVLLAPAAPT